MVHQFEMGSYSYTIKWMQSHWIRVVMDNNYFTDSSIVMLEKWDNHLIIHWTGDDRHMFPQEVRDYIKNFINKANKLKAFI